MKRLTNKGFSERSQQIVECQSCNNSCCDRCIGNCANNVGKPNQGNWNFDQDSSNSKDSIARNSKDFTKST